MAQKRRAPIDARTWTVARVQKISALRTGDAECLRDAKDDERLFGAFYMAGYAIESSLRAKVLERYPHLNRRENEPRKGTDDARRWALLYKDHNLQGLLEELTEAFAVRVKRAGAHHAQHIETLKRLCSQWSVFERYTTQPRKRRASWRRCARASVSARRAASRRTGIGV